jgi:hypothetical protein
MWHLPLRRWPLESPHGAAKAAAPAKGQTVGVIVVSAVSGSVCIRSVAANANPDSGFDVDKAFVAAVGAAHIKKVAHGRYPFC